MGSDDIHVVDSEVIAVFAEFMVTFGENEAMVCQNMIKSVQNESEMMHMQYSQMQQQVSNVLDTYNSLINRYNSIRNDQYMRQEADRLGQIISSAKSPVEWSQNNLDSLRYRIEDFDVCMDYLIHQVEYRKYQAMQISKREAGNLKAIVEILNRYKTK